MCLPGAPWATLILGWLRWNECLNSWAIICNTRKHTKHKFSNKCGIGSGIRPECYITLCYIGVTTHRLIHHHTAINVCLHVSPEGWETCESCEQEKACPKWLRWRVSPGGCAWTAGPGESANLGSNAWKQAGMNHGWFLTPGSSCFRPQTERKISYNWFYLKLK